MYKIGAVLFLVGVMVFVIGVLRANFGTVDALVGNDEITSRMIWGGLILLPIGGILAGRRGLAWMMGDRNP